MALLSYHAETLKKAFLAKTQTHHTLSLSNPKAAHVLWFLHVGEPSSCYNAAEVVWGVMDILTTAPILCEKACYCQILTFLTQIQWKPLNGIPFIFSKCFSFSLNLFKKCSWFNHVFIWLSYFSFVHWFIVLFFEDKSVTIFDVERYRGCSRLL